MFDENLVLLKNFVTKAYQLDSEDLDYQVIDYRIALKVVESEINEEYATKYTDRGSTRCFDLCAYTGFEQVKEVLKLCLMETLNDHAEPVILMIGEK